MCTTKIFTIRTRRFPHVVEIVNCLVTSPQELYRRRASYYIGGAPHTLWARLLSIHYMPLTRNQAFNQPVRCLSKPNTLGQQHSGVPGNLQSPKPYPWVQQSSALQPNAEPTHLRHIAFSRSSIPRAQETASHHWDVEQLLRLLEADPLRRHDKLMP